MLGEFVSATLPAFVWTDVADDEMLWTASVGVFNSPQPANKNIAGTTIIAAKIFFKCFFIILSSFWHY